MNLPADPGRQTGQTSPTTPHSPSRPLLRYALHRLVALPGILLGVILLTFILFNVVGGSPAASVLGKNASPQALEEFDERNGFNKPLIVGRWTATRAFATPDFNRSPSPWSTNAIMSHVHAEGSQGCLSFKPSNAAFSVPLAFPLLPHTRYQWVIRYRHNDFRQGASFFQRTVIGTGVTHRLDFQLATRTRTARIDFTTGHKPEKEGFWIGNACGTLDIEHIELRRRMPHPFDSQFIHYALGLARLDFGVSTEANEKVSRLILEGLGPSLFLTIPMFVGTLLVAVFLGLLSAWFRDRLPDRLLVLGATVLMSVNYVVWVIAGQYLLAFRLGWFPVWGFESWAYLVLPVLIGMATGAGRDLRFYRAVILDEMNREYVRTARAKGAGPARILFRHVLPNVFIPIITNVSLNLPFLFTGSLLLESYFGIPGLGNLSLNAIHAADVNVVRAIVIIGAVLYMLANLAADLAYGLVDPRARME